MTRQSRSIRAQLSALALGAALAAGAVPVSARPMPHLAVAASAVPVEQARSLLRGVFDALADDDDYVHDDHYDWNDYRNATSRKERVRDYQRMQLEAQKDYWKSQKDMQKKLIKQQRGW